MALSNQLAAYDDCIDTFEKALKTGARVCFKTKGEAQNFMMRMHQARALQREETQRLYERSDIRWGKSSYDRLIVRQPVEDSHGFWWVYIERTGANIIAIELLEPSHIPEFESPSDDKV